LWIGSQIRNLTTDLEQTREQLEEEQEAKSELQRQVTKLNAEVHQWRARYESEGSIQFYLTFIHSILFQASLVPKNWKKLKEN
jgi:predicted nuclease with TOPRIM domain